MSLKGQIQNDMKDAMRAGDKDRLKVVRLMLAAVKQIEVDTRRDVDDPSLLRILEKMVKQRRDSVEQFAKGGRTDLVEIELAEIAVLESYLPEPLSDEEVRALIDAAINETGATGIRDMGKVMSRLRDATRGRADMAAVGGLVRARLGAD